MEIDFSEINYLQNPTWKELHADYEQFLLSMSGPTVIDVTGVNTHKCRVFISLLQGNEPSGFIALHRWLITKNVNDLPQTNLRFIICSVEAASKKPFFSRATISDCQDISRSFGKPEHQLINQDNSNTRAQLIKKAIREVKPEAVIDLHNTIGPSPAFAISCRVTVEALSLTSFFCHTLVLSDVNSASLMGQDFSCSFVTIECGGRFDEQAHEIAFAGISHIANSKSIDYTHQKSNVEVIYRPLRLRLKGNTELSYADHDEGNKGITLKSNIEYLNFGGAQKNELIGWLDGDGINNVQLLDKEGNNVIDSYFYSRDNQLVCRKKLHIFKATSSKQAALNDCLFYVAKNTNNED